MSTHVSARSASIKFSEKNKTTYCIPLWLRDLQIDANIKKVRGRIQAFEGKRTEPIAVVGFGPSLQETWERIRGFKWMISTSGAHRFLIDRGIIPTWHIEVDPRKHKIKLLGEPHPEVTYLPASTVHPSYLDHLAGHKVELWHVFANEEDAMRTLPREEWALFGGPDVGQRALAIARFFGFTELHVFGIDGCAGPESMSHAAEHPNAPRKFQECEYPEGSGRKWRTTPSLLECAKAIPHELDMLKDVTATFYGDTLAAEVVKNYVRTPKPKGTTLGVLKPAVISAQYLDLNRRLHVDNLAYGVGGGKHAKTVKTLCEKLATRSVLDYGCGKSMLAKALPFPIWEYDPAIEGKDESPRPADLVVCTDVLEHIEPELLDFVLDDLRRVTRKIGFFVIHTGASHKTLADGRNTHLIQQPREWWHLKLARFFQVAQIKQAGPELYCVVAPLKPVKQTVSIAPDRVEEAA